MPRLPRFGNAPIRTDPINSGNLSNLGNLGNLLGNLYSFASSARFCTARPVSRTTCTQPYPNIATAAPPTTKAIVANSQNTVGYSCAATDPNPERERGRRKRAERRIETAKRFQQQVRTNGTEHALVRTAGPATAVNAANGLKDTIEASATALV